MSDTFNREWGNPKSSAKNHKRFLRSLECKGEGASKVVYVAYDTQTGREVAWADVPMDNLSMSQKKNILREIDIMKKLKHPSLTTLIDAWFDTASKKVVIISPLGTPLRKFCRRWKEALTLITVRRWCNQILQGLDYLHNCKPSIVHRDMKIENLLLSASGDIKIVDYGVARFIDEKKRTEQTNMNLTRFVGTPTFMAPEMYETDVSYDFKVDIYAFGMVMLEIVACETPYSVCRGDPHKILVKLIHGEMPLEINKVRHKDVRDIVLHCLHKDPKKRPTAKDLLENDFFNRELSVEEKHSNTALNDLEVAINHVNLSRTNGSEAEVDAEAAKKLQAQAAKTAEELVVNFNAQLDALRANVSKALENVALIEKKVEPKDEKELQSHYPAAVKSAMRILEAETANRLLKPKLNIVFSAIRVELVDQVFGAVMKAEAAKLLHKSEVTPLPVGPMGTGGNHLKSIPESSEAGNNTLGTDENAIALGPGSSTTGAIDEGLRGDESHAKLTKNTSVGMDVDPFDGLALDKVASLKTHQTPVIHSTPKEHSPRCNDRNGETDPFQELNPIQSTNPMTVLSLSLMEVKNKTLPGISTPKLALESHRMRRSNSAPMTDDLFKGLSGLTPAKGETNLHWQKQRASDSKLAPGTTGMIGRSPRLGGESEVGVAVTTEPEAVSQQHAGMHKTSSIGKRNSLATRKRSTTMPRRSASLSSLANQSDPFSILDGKSAPDTIAMARQKSLQSKVKSEANSTAAAGPGPVSQQHAGMHTSTTIAKQIPLPGRLRSTTMPVSVLADGGDDTASTPRSASTSDLSFPSSDAFSNIGKQSHHHPEPTNGSVLKKDRRPSNSDRDMEQRGVHHRNTSAATDAALHELERFSSSGSILPTPTPASKASLQELERFSSSNSPKEEHTVGENVTERELDLLYGADGDPSTKTSQVENINRVKLDVDKVPEGNLLPMLPKSNSKRFRDGSARGESELSLKVPDQFAEEDPFEISANFLGFSAVEFGGDLKKDSMSAASKKGSVVAGHKVADIDVDHTKPL